MTCTDESSPGLDTLTSGKAFIGDADVSLLNDQKLTILRRDRVGFIFQAYNLVPTLTAIENITLPLTLAGHRATRRGSTGSSRPSAWPAG